MDVENIDALNPAELDALLERALDPQVPVEVFYAVLERIGPHEPPAQPTSAQPAAETPGQTWSARPGQCAQSGPAGAQPANGSPSTASSQPPAVQPLPLSLPAPGSQTPAAVHHQASQGTKSAFQQSSSAAAASAQQAAIGRRVAQHGPPPRGFALPVSDTEATAVMRPVTDAEASAFCAAAGAATAPESLVSPTAQTTVMPAVPAAESDERGDQPAR